MRTIMIRISSFILSFLLYLLALDQCTTIEVKVLAYDYRCGIDAMDLCRINTKIFSGNWANFAGATVFFFWIVASSVRVLFGRLFDPLIDILLFGSAVMFTIVFVGYQAKIGLPMTLQAQVPATLSTVAWLHFSLFGGAEIRAWWIRKHRCHPVKVVS